ncbi:DUF300-domain-containing protein [Sistotremastrum niveocremeum HHB9708]|uniref:DUF300-domain-containing protein n=1 Tax=Sistotremastrum niveocremeum HHB9708 TaxID=1314777 RepID=A0A164PNZ7_9AGAM|nr:DUF300-domain-containing protein [Sistotremastrum niveocremeum HHB9708]
MNDTSADASDRCFQVRAASKSPPLIQNGVFVLQTHHIGWIISGIFSLVATAVSFYLIYHHLSSYTKKRQQRYIVRILLMVPIYANVSLLSYILWNHSTPIILIRDCYEAFVLTAFFYLLLQYLAPSTAEQNDIFRNMKINDWVFPFGRVGWKPDGLYFLQLMKWGVLQYCLLRPLTTVIAVTLNTMGLYCDDSWSPAWGHLYITIIVSLSVTLCPSLLPSNDNVGTDRDAYMMWNRYCLIQLYVQIAEPIKEHKPMLKLVSIKAVVFLTFWQSVIISGFSVIGLIKDTQYMTADDINIGIECLLETFEMMYVLPPSLFLPSSPLVLPSFSLHFFRPPARRSVVSQLSQLYYPVYPIETDNTNTNRIFAFIHLRAFSYAPYAPYTPSPSPSSPSHSSHPSPIAKYTRLRALGHTLDPRETIRECRDGVLYMVHRIRGGGDLAFGSGGGRGMGREKGSGLGGDGDGGDWEGRERLTAPRDREGIRRVQFGKVDEEGYEDVGVGAREYGGRAYGGWEERGSGHEEGDEDYHDDRLDEEMDLDLDLGARPLTLENVHTHNTFHHFQTQTQSPPPLDRSSVPSSTRMQMHMPVPHPHPHPQQVLNLDEDYYSSPSPSPPRTQSFPSNPHSTPHPKSHTLSKPDSTSSTQQTQPLHRNHSITHPPTLSKSHLNTPLDDPPPRSNLEIYRIVRGPELRRMYFESEGAEEGDGGGGLRVADLNASASAGSGNGRGRGRSEIAYTRASHVYPDADANGNGDGDGGHGIEGGYEIGEDEEEDEEEEYEEEEEYVRPPIHRSIGSYPDYTHFIRNRPPRSQPPHLPSHSSSLSSPFGNTDTSLSGYPVALQPAIGGRRHSRHRRMGRERMSLAIPTPLSPVPSSSYHF